MNVYAFGGIVVLLWVLWRYSRPHEDASFLFLVNYYHRTMLREARCRGDALFDVNHSDAIYAEIIPRRIWSDLGAGANEAEAGLLLVDGESRRFLFEGDRQRWIIPFAAVRGWEIEVLTVGQTAFHLAMLRFDTAEGIKELPLATHTGLPGVNRFERAGAFCELLNRTLVPNSSLIEEAEPTEVH